ncbi:hypothetical protein EYE40_11465 [Glaciihabitans arcticus]|uniref:YdbS-like PH domain-containing protein n=2 Tax=Glaciihabitans arcticus TaxID=2668039 RepID=A0A4Q9GV04_9MICO|nr:hypothetical protein EYE40_11465 [Glaciihabitans arcticus]
MHPLTPLLKGGIALVAILGYFVYQAREVLIDRFLGVGNGEGDPLVWLVESDFLLLAIGVIIGGLLIFIGGFYLSWRMHTFRITDEVVEVRSGILFRTNRRGRLDRIQGINITRPFLARLFGTAKLEVNVAGDDANVQLEYLGSAAADELRREVLRLASGTKVEAATETVVGPTGSLVEQRVAELLAPELNAEQLAAQSVVKMHLGRLIGSLVLSGTTIFLIGFIIAGFIVVSLTGELFYLGGAIPAVLGMASFYYRRFTRSLRYSIAGTPDGVRVGFGLLSTSNETLPPGRIHSVLVSQPLLWRPFGWWEIKITRASKSSAKGAAGQENTTILPVGHIHDVMQVLALILPDMTSERDAQLLHRGLVSPGGDDGFVNSPKRAAPIRWFSWRRNGYALSPSSVLLRKGRVWRELIVVPTARIQSVALEDGPLLRRLGLGALRVHTVAGPVTASLGAVDRVAAVDFFEIVSAAAVSSSSTDTSHRWRSGEALA